MRHVVDLSDYVPAVLLLNFASRVQCNQRILQTEGVFWRLTLEYFLARNIKIRPASVKTFDEVTMEDGTNENHEVSYSFWT